MLQAILAHFGPQPAVALFFANHVSQPSQVSSRLQDIDAIRGFERRGLPVGAQERRKLFDELIRAKPLQVERRPHQFVAAALVELIKFDARHQAGIQFLHVHHQQHVAVVEQREPAREQHGINQVAHFREAVFPSRRQVEVSRRGFLPFQAFVRDIRQPLKHCRPGLPAEAERHQAVRVGASTQLVGVRWKCRRRGAFDVRGRRRSLCRSGVGRRLPGLIVSRARCSRSECRLKHRNHESSGEESSSHDGSSFGWPSRVP